MGQEHNAHVPHRPPVRGVTLWRRHGLRVCCPFGVHMLRASRLHLPGLLQPAHGRKDPCEEAGLRAPDDWRDHARAPHLLSGHHQQIGMIRTYSQPIRHARHPPLSGFPVSRRTRRRANTVSTMDTTLLRSGYPHVLLALRATGMTSPMREGTGSGVLVWIDGLGPVACKPRVMSHSAWRLGAGCGGSSQEDPASAHPHPVSSVTHTVLTRLRSRLRSPSAATLGAVGCAAATHARTGRWEQVQRRRCQVCM
mmetsp:Transcript_13684/g.36637  ORF Transcript_13684/g.36637 Transcript_13684/m.36637 type:complete len:252 (+) Transcript_13684:1466-2221(+)